MDAPGPAREIPSFKSEAPDFLEQADLGDFRRWSTRKRKAVSYFSQAQDPFEFQDPPPPKKPRKRKVKAAVEAEPSSKAEFSGKGKSSAKGKSSGKSKISGSRKTTRQTSQLLPQAVKKERASPDYPMLSDFSESDSSCYEVDSGASESDSSCFEVDSKGKRVRSRRRKKTQKVDRSKLLVQKDPRFDYQALDGIKQIFDEAASHEVSDLVVPSHMGGSPQRRDAKDQAIQQYLQGMLERRSPPGTEKKKLLNIRVLAEAARILGCVRCDGWCYNWLAEWSLAESCPQIRMVEITCKKRKDLHNHYFLLVPCKPEQALNSGWSDSEQKKLYDKGKLDEARFSSLTSDGFLLIDPALFQVMPFDQRYFPDYIKAYCKAYDRVRPTQLSIRTVYDLDKRGVQLSPEDIEQMRQRALYLLPFATVFQSEYDFKAGVHRYPQIFNELRFKPHESLPELFREDVTWNIGAMFCLFNQDDKFKATLPQGRPSNLDILKCYRSESQKYFDVLKEEMIKMLKCGFSLEDCLNFLGPRGKTSHYCQIPCEVPIPDAIYRANKKRSQLKGPLDWQGLGEKAFELMGINPSAIQPDFPGLVLRMYEIREEYSLDRLSDSLLTFFSYGMEDGKGQYQYRQNMVFNRPELKNSVCSPPRKISAHLMKHCIYQDREKMAEELQPLIDLWAPTHTLHVCKADTPPHEEAMVVFLQNCVHDFMTPVEIVTALTQIIPGTFEEERLAIELPAELRSQSFDHWNVEAVNTLMASYKEKGWVKETTRDHQVKFLMARIKELWPKRDNHAAQRDMTQYLLRHRHFAEKVAYCYPQFSAKKLQDNIASCMRFLIKEFDSPLAKLPTSKDHLFTLTDYDLPLLLKDDDEDSLTRNRSKVEEILTEGHNLSYVARRKFRKGRPKEGCLAVNNPYRSEPTCDWSFADMLELMRNEGESDKDCMKRLYEQYGDDNESLRMEYGVYLAKGDVSEYDGLMVDYVHGPGKTKRDSRLRSFRYYAERNFKDEFDRKCIPAYETLKTQAEAALAGIAPESDSDSESGSSSDPAPAIEYGQLTPPQSPT